MISIWNKELKFFQDFALTGVDVMITILCDFLLFSAKKLAFFLNTNVTIKYFFKIQLCFESKTPILWRKFLNNPYIGPRSTKDCELWSKIPYCVIPEYLLRAVFWAYWKRLCLQTKITRREQLCIKTKM
jgi:hypothetical protein